MAKAVATPRSVEVALTMNADEAKYVLGALYYTNPREFAKFGGDPVYFELYGALEAAGLNLDGFDPDAYAEPNNIPPRRNVCP